MGVRLLVGIALAASLTLGMAAAAFAQTGGSGGSGGSGGGGGSGGSGGTGTTTPPTTSAVNPSGGTGTGSSESSMAKTGMEVGIPLAAAGGLVVLALGTRELARRRVDS